MLSKTGSNTVGSLDVLKFFSKGKADGLQANNPNSENKSKQYFLCVKKIPLSVSITLIPKKYLGDWHTPKTYWDTHCTSS